MIHTSALRRHSCFKYSYKVLYALLELLIPAILMPDRLIQAFVFYPKKKGGSNMEYREFEANSKKRPYTAPLLVEFGTVVNLTGA